MAQQVSTRHAILSLGLLVLVGVFWGCTPVFMKFAMMSDIPPVGYVTLQSFGSGMVSLVVCLLRGVTPPLNPSYLRYYLLSGLGNVALPQISQATALKHIPVTVAALIVSISPMLTYAISVLIRIERIQTRRLAGVCLGFVGVALIVLPRSSLPAPDMLPWVLLTLVTPICFATSNVYIGVARPRDVDSLALGGAMSLSAAAGLFPVAWMMDALYLPSLPLTPGDYALFAHMITSGIGTLLFFEVMRLAGPVLGGQVGYLITINGVLSGIIVFGESPSAWVWAALVACLSGLVLIAWPRKAQIVSAVAADKRP